jgi:hypothetical protein
MQGPQINTLTQNYGVNAFTKKNCGKETQNITFFMFPNFGKCLSSNKREGEKKKVSSIMWMLCRSSFHCILKMSQNLKGLETHMLLIMSPD